MKHGTIILATALSLLVGSTMTPAAQAPASIQAEMLKDWTDLKTTMGKIASEMPEDKFAFKATLAERSYGEQVVHAAQANVGILRTIDGSAPAPALDPKATGKAAAIKAIDASFDYGIALLKEQTDQTLLQPIPTPPPFLGPSSRARVFTFLMGHTWDIYGQMAVYLRLSGLVPPASQRR
jgi:uncharacterized damage-inducible protein DinB